MAPTGWSKGPWSESAKPERWKTRQAMTPAADGAAGVAAAAAGPGTAAAKRARAEALLSESVPNLHPEAGGNIPGHGRGGAGWGHGFPAVACLGPAPGRLSHHTNPDVLPGREPGGRDVFHPRAAREAVRPGA